MNRESYLITGSKKPWFYLRVDVESILADIMAIRLRQALRRLEIQNIKSVSAKSCKRKCNSYDESELPLKKKRSK